jgi:hypothetical protein
MVELTEDGAERAVDRILLLTHLTLTNPREKWLSIQFTPSL